VVSSLIFDVRKVEHLMTKVVLVIAFLMILLVISVMDFSVNFVVFSIQLVMEKFCLHFFTLLLINNGYACG
jgi:hypothetical protein